MRKLLTVICGVLFLAATVPASVTWAQNNAGGGPGNSGPGDKNSPGKGKGGVGPGPGPSGPAGAAPD
jgi:hypothetical protein